VRSLALGSGSIAVAAGLAGWLAIEAGPDAVDAVGPLGAVAVVATAGAVVLARHELLVGALVLLGAAYAVILAVDDPALDGRSAIVGALLLGYTETIVAFKASIEWSQIVSVAAVLIVLIVRPAGFFGKRAAF